MLMVLQALLLGEAVRESSAGREQWLPGLVLAAKIDKQYPVPRFIPLGSPSIDGRCRETRRVIKKGVAVTADHRAGPRNIREPKGREHVGI